MITTPITEDKELPVALIAATATIERTAAITSRLIAAEPDSSPQSPQSMLRHM
jgi:hypothetical protein